MTDDRDPASSDPDTSASDEMAQYLQVYIEESDEELESLVEAILRLERNPHDDEALHKSFRMLHSLKGSSGMLGFEIVGGFAHELEDRFERYRSGQTTLDRDTTTLILECVDFLKAFVERLRTGDMSEGDPQPLLARLRELEQRRVPESSPSSPAIASPLSSLHLPAMTMSGGMKIVVKFRRGLQLADLKARLIVSRLSSLGEIIGCDPPMDDTRSFEELPLFSMVLITDRPIDDIRKVANVDGVESVEIEGGGVTSKQLAAAASPDVDPIVETPVEPPSASFAKESLLVEPTATAETGPAVSTATEETNEGKTQVSESLRVDIGRLDDLLNLTGELVVAQARFSQITDEMSPMFRRGGVSNRSREVFDRLRQRIHQMRMEVENAEDENDRLTAHFLGFDEDLEILDQQSTIWEEGRQYFGGIAEATDQLMRVSKNLQRGVLSTRMVPVAPLFNRFKRVVRDLSVSRGKQVHLSILGEKTELDKRMIDALGDPLLHLVRNSIDHGLESAADRRAAGKPDIGTVCLEAAHRGNNVLIMVRDDGGGINIPKIRARVAERGLATASQVEELNDQQILSFIWHPGFSTAEKVTEISGRGVGMDIVQSAITALNGTIDVASTPGTGTAFTIRLPLTLAIIHSLLVRFRESCFSIPIDDVREIVSVSQDQVHKVHRYSTIDVRGELIPLMDMVGIFDWSENADDHARETIGGDRNSLNVVILQSRGKTLGLSVDSLVGRADIVIKSLSENFSPVRGLSGASILGDGSVSLMLDTTSLIELATERTSVRTAL